MEETRLKKTNNWKSTLAFFIFIGIYVYTIYKDSGSTVIEVTGYIALYSSLFMMFRSDFTTELLGKIVDKIKMGS